MIIYYMPVFVLYVLSNFKLRQLERISRKIIVILLGIFLCTTYFNGSDWRQYEVIYNLAEYKNLTQCGLEKGFYIYILVFKSLGVEFWNFFIITKLLCFYSIYSIIKRYSNNIFFSLMIFYATLSLFLFIDCPLRNLIAVAIFFNAEKNLQKKQYIKYFIKFLLAFSFHQSAIVMIILPFIKKIGDFNRKKILLIVLVISIFLINQSILLKIIEIFPEKLSDRVISYIGGEYFKQTYFSIGTIEKTAVMIFSIWNKEKIIQNRKYKSYLVSMLVIYFIFYRLGFTIDILGRFTLYFSVFYILILDSILEYLKKCRYIILFLLFFYSLLSVHKQIKYSYKYLPYTSYLTYIFKEKPSYDFRKNYNIIKWEERMGKKFEEMKNE